VAGIAEARKSRVHQRPSWTHGQAIPSSSRRLSIAGFVCGRRLWVHVAGGAAIVPLRAVRIGRYVGRHLGARARNVALHGVAVRVSLRTGRDQ
jgi:hypothetical protein